MKLSISNIGWDKDTDIEMYAFMSQLGFVGLEIAPTRLFENPYSKLAEAKQFKIKLFEKYGLAISSMQSLWYGKQENIFGIQQERQALAKYTKMAIDFAAVLGCANLVMGSPKNRVLQNETHWELAVGFFDEIADYASQNGCVIALEPNPAVYGTNFINTTAQAIQFCKELSNPGLKVNLDFGTIIENRENLDLLSENIDLIHHVHISEPFLKPLNTRSLHHDLATILHQTAYTGYVSIEMAKTESLDDLKKAAFYIREVFV